MGSSAAGAALDAISEALWPLPLSGPGGPVCLVSRLECACKSPPAGGGRCLCSGLRALDATSRVALLALVERRQGVLCDLVKFESLFQFNLALGNFDGFNTCSNVRLHLAQVFV